MVPNFIDRSVWGAKEFGYISGAVPNITVKTTTSVKVSVPCTGWGKTGTNPGKNSAITSGRLIVGTGSKESGDEILESLSAAGNDRAATVTQGATSTASYANNSVRPTSLKVRVKTRFI